jgi:hypothetical protein
MLANGRDTLVAMPPRRRVDAVRDSGVPATANAVNAATPPAIKRMRVVNEKRKARHGRSILAVLRLREAAKGMTLAERSSADHQG